MIIHTLIKEYPRCVYLVKCDTTLRKINLRNFSVPLNI